MMFENEIIINGQDAIKFQKMLENPEERALTERDGFVLDVDIEFLLNGDIVVDCNCDFEELFQYSEICDLLVTAKKKGGYDTISINVESSRESSNVISRLTDNVWIDAEHAYVYGERCKYVSDKKDEYISDMLAVAS